MTVFVARLALVGALATLTACWRQSPVAPVANVAPVASKPMAIERSLAELTPPEIRGALLGQTTAQLLHARPNNTPEDENYDFRDHFIERLDRDGIETVHYYTLKDGGVMYQISFDFKDEGLASAMWQRYVSMGPEIKDLGGREIVIAMKPFEVRVWHNELRLQIMAVVENSEWWWQYHGGRDGTGDDSDDDGGDDDADDAADDAADGVDDADVDAP